MKPTWIFYLKHEYGTIECCKQPVFAFDEIYIISTLDGDKHSNMWQDGKMIDAVTIAINMIHEIWYMTDEQSIQLWEDEA